LATITIDENSFCYFRLDVTSTHNCAGTLDGIGMVVQLDVVVDSFLPLHGEDGGACLATCNSDDGASGIVPCICQVFNTLIPYRPDPAKAVILFFSFLDPLIAPVVKRRRETNITPPIHNWNNRVNKKTKKNSLFFVGQL